MFFFLKEAMIIAQEIDTLQSLIAKLYNPTQVYMEFRCLK